MPRLCWMLLVALPACVPKARHDALVARYEDLHLQLAALQSTAAGLKLQIADLEEQIAHLQESNVELSSFTTALLREFRAELEDEAIEVVVYPDRTSLVVTGETPAIARVLERHPERSFTVEGHGVTWERAAARAVEVVEALVEAGVPADRLAATAYADGDGAVEISYVPTLDELPGHEALVKAARVRTAAYR